MDLPEVTVVELEDDRDCSGLLLRTDGRVLLVSEGVGMGIRLDAEALRSLARQAWLVALLLDQQQSAAVEEVTADFRRVMGHA